MSVNFSQNPQYVQQNPNNFNGSAPIPEPPIAESMAKSMDLPTTPTEFVKFSPYFATAVGFSYFVSKLASWASHLNPKKYPNATVAESFANSTVGKCTRALDDKVFVPAYNKFSKPISATGGFLSRITPAWMKNIGQKLKIGVMPKWSMPKAQFYGMRGQSVNYFFDDILSKVPPEKLKELKIDRLYRWAAKHSDVASREKIFNRICERVSKVNVAKDLKPIVITTPRTGLLKWMGNKKTTINLVEELGKTKTFVAQNGKTKLSRGLQRLFIGSTEAAGGMVVGGPFGLIMNSIFTASAFKRTWDAPKEDKFSTFMEAILVDFIGQYYMMLLATKLSYHLFGLKNIDKTPEQIAAITKQLQKINDEKGLYKAANKALKDIGKHNPSQKELKELAEAFGKKADDFIDVKTAKKTLESLLETKAKWINNSIDDLAKMKQFQKQGFWKDLFHRPIKWAGDFMSMGLEMLPSKVKQAGKVSGLKSGLQKFKNFFKGGGGAILRFAFIMFVVTPKLTKPIVKLTHKIFGKPKKSYYDDYYLDDKKKAEAKKNKNNQKINMNDFTQFTKLTGAIKAQQNPNMYSSNYNPPISKTMKDGAIASQKSRISGQPSLVQESSQSNINDTATYVPSIVPTQFTDPAVQSALQQKLAFSDRVENYVAKELQAMKRKDQHEF